MASVGSQGAWTQLSLKHNKQSSECEKRAIVCKSPAVDADFKVSTKVPSSLNPTKSHPVSQPCPTMDLSPWAWPGPGNSSQLLLYIQLRNVIGDEHLNQCWASLLLTQLFPGTANKTPIFCTVTLGGGSSTWERCVQQGHRVLQGTGDTFATVVAGPAENSALGGKNAAWAGFKCTLESSKDTDSLKHSSCVFLPLIPRCCGCPGAAICLQPPRALLPPCCPRLSSQGSCPRLILVISGASTWNDSRNREYLQREKGKIISALRL